MNTNKVIKQLLTRNVRSFGLYNYTASTNSHVYLTVSQDGQKLRDLVFQLYDNHAPNTAANFKALASGVNSQKLTYEGSTFDKGYPGIYVSAGGDLSELSTDQHGQRQPEEGTLRHYKRGQLTMFGDGENSSGSRFGITLGKADIFDSYQTVFGELVEGEEVLKKIEESVDRLGHVNHNIKIDAAGTK